jgi:O-antigen/teichoic acid export membrane protein
MSSRRHAFNIGLNVTGMVLPMLVGVVTVPGLLQRLGEERFGILALGWVLVGYFGFLDLGMGRALTQYLASADKAGTSRQEQATVACAARRLLGGLSLLLALVLSLLLPWLVGADRKLSHF